MNGLGDRGYREGADAMAWGIFELMRAAGCLKGCWGRLRLSEGIAIEYRTYEEEVARRGRLGQPALPTTSASRRLQWPGLLVMIGAYEIT
jgi:hypothetical protein